MNSSPQRVKIPRSWGKEGKSERDLLSADPSGIQVAEIKLVVQSGVNTRYDTADLTRHKSFASAWRLMIKKSPVASGHPVALSVVDRDPVIPVTRAFFTLIFFL
jgi:hypothetical protein